MTSQDDDKKEAPILFAALQTTSTFDTTQQATALPHPPPPITKRPSSRKRKQPPSASPSNPVTADIVAGPHQTGFTVATSLLLKVPFFRSLIDNLMFKNEKPVIYLPQHWPGPVSVLLHWLQYNKIDPDVYANEEQKGTAQDAVPTAVPIKLFPIYQLAIVAGAEELQNKLINLFVQRFRAYRPRGWLLGMMLSDIGKEDKLYDLLMQLVATEVQDPKRWAVMKAGGEDWYVDFAKGKADRLEFMLDAMAKFPEGKKDGKGIWEMSLCEWHVHETTKKCGEEGKQEADAAQVTADAAT